MVVRVPSRATTAAAPIEATPRNPVSARKRTPVSTGDRCRVSWRYTVSRNSTAYMPNRPRKFTTQATATAGTRNRRGGSIGCGQRISHSTKSVRITALPSRSPRMTGEDQPKRPLSIIANVSDPLPSTNSVCPTVSGRLAASRFLRTPPAGAVPGRPSWRSSTARPFGDGRRGGDEGRVQDRPASATTPIGRLIQNMLSQPAVWTSSPPMIGPSATAVPATPPHTPMARVRCLGSANSSAVTASDSGTIAAANTPWPPRAAISIPGLGASAQATEQAVKPAVPVSRVALRPKRSPTDPAVSSRQAKPRV